MLWFDFTDWWVGWREKLFILCNSTLIDYDTWLLVWGLLDSIKRLNEEEIGWKDVRIHRIWQLIYSTSSKQALKNSTKPMMNISIDFNLCFTGLTPAVDMNAFYYQSFWFEFILTSLQYTSGCEWQLNRMWICKWEPARRPIWRIEKRDRTYRHELR